MGLFDDVLTAPPPSAPATPAPRRGSLFDDVLRKGGQAVTASRGAFGLGTAETIGARPPLHATEFFPQLLSTARQFGQAMVSRDVPAAFAKFQQLAPSVGIDALNVAALPVSLAVEQAGRLGTAPLRPISTVTRQALQGFPEDDRLTRAARMGVETVALNAAPTAARGIGRAAELTGVAAKARQMAVTRRILNAPVASLIQESTASGAKAAEVLRVLGRGRSTKFRPVYEAVQRQRQAPRQVAGFLPRPSASRLTLGREGSSVAAEGERRYVQPQLAFRREPLSVPPSTTLPRLNLADTHPGVTKLPVNPVAPAAPVVPIARQEADRLRGQSVELRPGITAPQVFREVPPHASATATGLQYWYKYDLPATTGTRYPRIRPTPSEGFEVREISRNPSQMTRAGFNKNYAGGIVDYVNNLQRANLKEITELTKQMVEAGLMTKNDLVEVTTLVLGEGGKEVTAPSGLSLMAAFHNIKVSAHFAHQRIVERALSEGKPVPVEIIESYREWNLDDAPNLSRQLAPRSSRVSEARPPAYRIQPLTRIRQQAIQAVTRDLVEQSRILSTESTLLKRRVLEAGGIRPTLGGGLREELQTIRLFLRQGGRAIDDLATELGFESGESLRNALLTAQRATRPTLAQLRQQATQVVDSEGGSRILQVLQTKGSTGQAIRRVVREVTQQTESEISRGLKQIRGVLRGAERKALTPTQLSRIAKSQRITPGEMLAGPRGGARPAPIGQEDITQIEQRIPGIVPRQPQISGQPPRIPRKRALVPADFAQHPFRDLTESQAAPLSGLDPRRAARLVDGQDFGPVRQSILDPAQVAAQAGRAAGQRDLATLHQAVPNLHAVTRLPMSRGPQESEQLFDLIEGRLNPKAITPRLQRAAGIMRETYDQLLSDLNVSRQRQGKVPIQRRDNYITHIQTLNLLDDFYYGLNNVPDDALAIPNVTTHPNSPFFQFALKRLGGPHAKDAVEAFRRYVVKANAVIAHAPALQATRPLIRFLPPRAQGYFTQYLDEVLALKKAKADTLAPRPILNAIRWLRHQVGGGAILGNLSSVFNQLWTVPATVARVGPLRAVGASGELLSATGKDILNRLILRVGARDYAQAVLDLHKPTVRDFIDQHSPLMQNRRFEIEFDPTTMRRIDKVLGALIQSVDQEMVRLAWLAQFRKSAREGKAFAHAVREAEETAFATQSGYTPEDLPPAFRSQIAGAFAQFQNSVNNIFNFLRFDVGIQPLTLARDFRGHTGRNPQLLKQALLFFGTVYAMKMLYEHAGIPSAVDGPEDLVPLWGMAEYGPPAFWSPADAVLSLATADTPLERAKAAAKLKRAAFLLLGRGGNQLRKTLDGIVAVSKGGKFDKRGRLLFPIRETMERGRALLFGIYGTKAGQAYIRRGFKPKTKRSVNLIDAYLNSPVPASSTNATPSQRGRLFEDVLTTP